MGYGGKSPHEAPVENQHQAVPQGALVPPSHKFSLIPSPSCGILHTPVPLNTGLSHRSRSVSAEHTPPVPKRLSDQHILPSWSTTSPEQPITASPAIADPCPPSHHPEPTCIRISPLLSPSIKESCLIVEVGFPSQRKYQTSKADPEIAER